MKTLILTIIFVLLPFCISSATFDVVADVTMPIEIIGDTSFADSLRLCIFFTEDSVSNGIVYKYDLIKLDSTVFASTTFIRNDSGGTFDVMPLLIIQMPARPDPMDHNFDGVVSWADVEILINFLWTKKWEW